MADRKPRTDEQKQRRKDRDRERRGELAQTPPAPKPAGVPIPALKVQRMGKMFRIAYAETRNLAKFNSGEPVDGGGYEDDVTAQIELQKIIGEQGPTLDSEEEGVGP
jgi:hypothetical protein